MSDPLASVRPGDGLPHRADTFNLLFEAARAHRATKTNIPASELIPHDPLGPTCRVLVRNDTGGSLLGFSVVRLGDAIVSPVDHPYPAARRPAFATSAPVADTDVFAITQTPLAAGKIGPAAVLGVTVCTVNVTDAAHGYARPSSGVLNNLVSAETGPARIIWRETGTGFKVALVLLTGAWGSRPAAGCGLVYDEEADEYAVDMEVDAGQTVTLNVDTHTEAGPSIATGGVLTLPYERRVLTITFNACGMPIGFAVGEPEELEETVDVCDAGCYDTISYGASVLPCVAGSRVVVTGGVHAPEEYTPRVVVTGGGEFSFDDAE